jgi:hypothetical protein
MPKTMELNDAEVALIERMRKSDAEKRAEALLEHKRRAQEAIDKIDAELAGEKYAAVRTKLGIQAGK